MVNKLFKGISIFTFGITLFSLVGKNSVNAYNTSYESLNIPTGYYDSLNLNLTDEDFRRSLSSIISSGYIKRSYDAANDILAESDENPNNPGKQTGFYSGVAISKGTWNREHVWAKSHGFATSSWDPYSDCHHLRPTMVSINSSRGNLDFGEVEGGTPDQYGNKIGDVFEPRDEVKGDVARIMFYMATRYGFESPYNLTLTNDRTTSISKTGNGKFGNLQTLLKWNYEDPVSREEIYRNNVVYSYQHNRNPYIDHPEYVDLAYPSQYSTNISVDQTKVDSVIAKINTIPSTVDLTTMDLIAEINTLYNSLNFKEKLLVTNYSILENANKTISQLSGNNDNSGNTGNDDNSGQTSEVTEGLTVDFTKCSSESLTYTTNYNKEVDGKNFYFSSLGIYFPEFRFGHNKTTQSLPSSMQAVTDQTTGIYLTCNFDVLNAKNFNLTFDKTYGTPTSWYLLGSNDNGVTYKKLATGSSFTNGAINATLDKSETLKFTLVVTGTTPRLVLNKLTITSVSEDAVSDIDLSNEGVNVSLSCGYTMKGDEILSKCALNFKTTIANEQAGIIYIETSKLAEGKIKDLYNNESLEEFLNENEDVKFQKGNKVSLTNIEADVAYTAVVVVIADDKIYFGNETTYSIKEAIQYYFANNLITDENQIKVLTNIIN